MDKVALFIDGANTYAATRQLGFNIDYGRLMTLFASRGKLIRATYYTATLIDEQGRDRLRPMLDWLSYHSFQMVTKGARTFQVEGREDRVKGNMDIEIAVDMLSAMHIVDQMYLLSGDGDFTYLIKEIQRKSSAQVCVVSTIETKPAMIADILRRQADEFIDLVNIRESIQQL